MRLLASLACLLALSACGVIYKIDVQQGNYVTQETAARLKVGMTRGEVRQLLGTPLLSDVFHADRWDYFFSSVKRRRTEDRTRLTILFKDDKVVEWTGSAQPNPPAPTGPSAPPRQ